MNCILLRTGQDNESEERGRCDVASDPEDGKRKIL